MHTHLKIVYIIMISSYISCIYNIISALGDIDTDVEIDMDIIVLNVSVHITEIQAAYIGLYTTAEWF